MQEPNFTKVEERKFTIYILVGFLVLITIGVIIGIFFGGRGIELFIAVVIAAFIGYGIGETIGVNKGIESERKKQNE
jgi:hypothetical protein